jgi:serine/threonine-protein kinase SRPK3
MHVGELLADRYLIIQKLGWGHFSTVWLAKDTKFNTYVALKLQRSAPHYLEAAFDEVEILDQASTYWMKEDWLESLKKYYADEPEKL